MINRLSLIIIFVLGFLTAEAQKYQGIPSLVWPKLYDISYDKTASGPDYMKPSFSEPVKKLDGTMVTIPGYMIPFQAGYSGDHFILSSLPVNACFFCGVGGPETVIEVYMKRPLKYNDQPVEIKGRFRLNQDDPNHLFYIIEDAEYLGTVGL